MLQATQAAHRTERSTASRTLLRRANEDLSEGRFVSARIAFQRVRQNTALRGEALVGLAHVEFQLGNLHAAEAFATVAAREGGGAAANLTLGNIYFRLQKFQQAIDRYRRVLAESPQHPEARRNLLVAEHRLQAASHGRR